MIKEKYEEKERDDSVEEDDDLFKLSQFLTKRNEESAKWRNQDKS